MPGALPFFLSNSDSDDDVVVKVTHASKSNSSQPDTPYLFIAVCHQAGLL